MKDAEEIRKAMLSSNIEEIVAILNTLDNNSIVLAKTYMSALADKQKLEEARQTTLGEDDNTERCLEKIG